MFGVAAKFSYGDKIYLLIYYIISANICIKLLAYNLQKNAFGQQNICLQSTNFKSLLYKVT